MCVGASGRRDSGKHGMENGCEMVMKKTRSVLLSLLSVGLGCDKIDWLRCGGGNPLLFDYSDLSVLAQLKQGRCRLLCLRCVTRRTPAYSRARHTATKRQMESFWTILRHTRIKDRIHYTRKDRIYLRIFYRTMLPGPTKTDGDAVKAV